MKSFVPAITFTVGAALSAATFRPKPIPQSLYDELDSLVENDA